MSPLSTLILPLLLASTTVQAALVEYWWNVTYATANPDGLFERHDVIGVNGSWPPPPIFVSQNDTLIVHCTNSLTSSLSTVPKPNSLKQNIGTSLHSHGIFFNGSNYYDGAAGTTQCAIPEGMTLSYEVPVDLNVGSYWIHGHYNNQYTDGLRAPLIILPSQPRTDVQYEEEEFVVILSDWYHDNGPSLVENYFLNWINPTGAEPVPKSAVIYVATVNSSSPSTTGRYLSSIAEIANGTGVSADVGNGAVIPVKEGKKYRVRVINMSALAMFHLQIDQHNITIIELDGVEVSPQDISILPIAVAQRYSFILETKNTTTTNFPFMIYQDSDMYDAVPDSLVLNNSITIQYDEAYGTPEAISWEEDSWGMFDDTIFVPVEELKSAEADEEYTLNFAFDTFSDGTNRASFNVPELWNENITYQMTMVPALVTQMTMGNDSNDAKVYGQMTNPIIMKHMDNVEITVVNWDAGNHPFHLHGHNFQVMQKSFDMFSNDTSLNPPLVENQTNPSRRDTISIPGGGFVRLRFRADNPGAWLFHCHIDWHMSSGLAVTMITDPTWTQSQLTIPAAITAQCAAQGIATSGNVVGLMSTTDFKGQPFGPWPITMGWTPKAIGALAGCIITAILGFLTVAWYGWGGLDDELLEKEIIRERAIKKAKGGKFGAIKAQIAKVRA